MNTAEEGRPKIKYPRRKGQGYQVVNITVHGHRLLSLYRVNTLSKWNYAINAEKHAPIEHHRSFKYLGVNFAEGKRGAKPLDDF